MKLLDKEVKNKFKAGWKSLAFIAVLYIVVYAFNISLIGLFIAIGILMLGTMIWKKKFQIKPFIKLAVMYIVLSVLLYILQPLGVWAGIIILFLFGAWILYNRWDTYIWAVEQGQKAIWGDTFKNMKEKGIKRPKVKFRLRKEKIKN